MDFIINFHKHDHKDPISWLSFLACWIIQRNRPICTHVSISCGNRLYEAVLNKNIYYEWEDYPFKDNIIAQCNLGCLEIQSVSNFKMRVWNCTHYNCVSYVMLAAGLIDKGIVLTPDQLLEKLLDIVGDICYNRKVK